MCPTTGVTDSERERERHYLFYYYYHFHSRSVAERQVFHRQVFRRQVFRRQVFRRQVFGRQVLVRQSLFPIPLPASRKKSDPGKFLSRSKYFRGSFSTVFVAKMEIHRRKEFPVCLTA